MTDKNYLSCPSCSTPVRQVTLEKFDGVCRRCHKQPFSFRAQWIFLGLMALACPAAALILDQEFADLEASGGTRSVNVVIAMAYEIAGRPGVLTLFGLITVLCAVLCFQAFRRSRTAVDRNSSSPGSQEAADDSA